MLGPPKVRGEPRPMVVSLEALVPRNHFYRHLDATLDLSFVRELVRDRYAPTGRPGVDPVVFFKLQLVLFFEGLRSERQLLRHAADRLSVRWYLGYDLDEPLPDHSSLTKIRQRLGLAVFQRFFERVVELCQQAGLIWGRELFFDATKVRANADLDSLVPRFYWRAKQHLADLFTDPPADGEAPPPCTEASLVPDAAETPMTLPVTLPPDEQQALATENQAQWRLLDEYRLDPDRPPNSSYQRLTDWRVSRTDPDAAPMNDGHRAALGYHDHYVVDGGKARIILAAVVTPADVMENTPMQDLLWRVCFRWKLHPKRAVGDTTYGTAENIRVLEEAGIRAYTPLPDFDQHNPFFGHKDFTYDPDRDVYTCPQGVLLRRRGHSDTAGVRVYRAPTAACQACPVRSRCTESRTGRKLSRSVDEAFRERVRGYHATEAYAKAMRKRQVWIEPLFGEAKEWHGLRRFRLRGLANVNIQGLQVAAGQNLKRLLTKWGWGRRPWPVGGASCCRQPTACSLL